MKISHRGIPKFQEGKNLWYKKLIDYDPNTYKYGYDVTKLVDGDMEDKVFDPWVSNVKGFDTSHRYQPTTGHGEFGVGGNHFNYTLGVEGQNYYKKFGQDILDSNGNFTPLGEAWAKAVDALLPEGSEASFYDKDGKLRTSWNTKYRDAHSRNPKSFSNLRDYVNYVRNDQILGARHNIFLNRGKRYFYKDENGKEHWVDPLVIGDYTVTKDPVRSEWNPEHTVYWEDYELTGPEDKSEEYYAGSLPQVEATAKRPERKPLYTGLKLPDKIEVPGNKTPVNHRQYGFDWSKVGEGFRNILNNPNIYSLGRLAWNIASNDKIYGEQLKGIKPVLKDPYLTHRQVVGDEATKQAYYRRAAQGQTKAARPFTSDADRQMAYQMEAKRVGDELRAQGDLADNQEIRRTSDESNQHQWANTQRATEVANYNTASINQANALKHNLKAQWRSANASSVDNALKEIQYRAMKRQAEEDAFNDQIFTLQQQQELLTNPKLLEARKEYQDVLNKHKLSDGSYNEYDDEVIKAKQKYQAAQLQIAIENKEKWREYKNKGIFFVKNGSKITRKVKDDMLYMSTRDVVKHFREMTKLSSDAQNRKQPKIERLTSHPKGSTRRYQQGGVAPFLVYTPITLGGETTTSSESSTSSTKASSKDTNAKDSLDFVKELFKELAGKGLQVDVNTVYSQFNNMFQKARLFGDELSTEDIQLMYLSAISKVNEIQRSKDIYDKAKSYATTNDALNEYAVTADGQYVIQDTKTGKVSFTKDLSELPKDKTPITNQHLLYLREYSPQLLLEQGNFIVENVVNNGMGINKIGAAIKALAGNIGSTTSKIEGLSEVQSKQVKAGVQLLAQTDGTPNGIYQVTTTNKNSSAQINAALDYIESMLSPSQRAILNAHGGTKPLIASFVASQTNSTLEQSITPVTGKASKSTNGSNSGDNDMIPAVAFFQGLGDNQTFIIQDKTLDGIKIDTVSQPITSGNKNTGSITFDKLESSDYGGQLRIDQATMGDALIAPNGRNNIIIGGKIYQTELPIDQQAATHNIIKPDFSFLKNIEKANQQLRNMGIDKNNPDDVAKNIDKINQVYRDNQLPILYTTDGDKPVITSSYARFAMVNATATKDAFEEDPNFNDGVREATDQERKQFESSMKQLSGNSKYTLNNGYFGGRIGGDDLYTGIIYIPMGTSTISALSGTGYKAKGEEYNQMEAAQQAANAAIQLGFKSAGNFSSHN